MSDMERKNPLWSSRILAALAYLTWVPLAYALYRDPSFWGEKKQVFMLVEGLQALPRFVLLFGLVAVWRSFEREHWFVAFVVTALHAVFSLVTLFICFAMAIIPILGGLVAIAVYYVFMPLWLLIGWSFLLCLATRALSGLPAWKGFDYVPGQTKRLDSEAEFPLAPRRQS